MSHGLTVFPGVDWTEGYLAAKLYLAMHPEPCDALEDFCPTKTAREKQKPAHIRIGYKLSHDGERFLPVVEVMPLNPEASVGA